jgi:hypothetical protein
MISHFRMERFEFNCKVSTQLGRGASATLAPRLLTAP